MRGLQGSDVTLHAHRPLSYALSQCFRSVITHAFPPNSVTQLKFFSFSKKQKAVFGRSYLMFLVYAPGVEEMDQEALSRKYY